MFHDVKFSYIDVPSFVGDLVGVYINQVVPKDDAVVFVTWDSGTGIYTSYTTVDFKSWTSATSTAMSPIPDTYSSVIWTGEYFFVAGWRSATGNITGYYSADLLSWSSYTIGTGFSSGIGGISLTASKNYVVVSVPRVDSTAVATWTLLKPISAPTITAVPSAYSWSSLASLSLSTDAVMIGPYFTANFVNFTQVVPSNAINTVNAAQPTSSYGFFLCSSSNGKSYYSKDGVGWTSFNFFATTSRGIAEVMTTAGPMIIDDQYAFMPQTGFYYYYDPHNKHENDWSGGLYIFKYKGSVYGWAPGYTNVRMLTELNSSQRMAHNLDASMLYTDIHV